MEIISKNEASWKVPVRKTASGEIEEILEHASEMLDDDEFIENVVFRARLRYLGNVRKKTHAVHHMFQDVESGVRLRFSPNTIDALLSALATGEVLLTEGLYEGLFTFVNYVGYVFAAPLDPATAADLKVK